MIPRPKIVRLVGSMAGGVWLPAPTTRRVSAEGVKLPRTGYIDHTWENFITLHVLYDRIYTGDNGTAWVKHDNITPTGYRDLDTAITALRMRGDTK